ncbi:hypothetical protein B0T21DRAFT_386004 [Apiosordaria backusii]|uniref:Mid2 domain-containing protein n=1 Tax=Apiosordaria backusii TaxID=314023 RepID=A0AA40E3N0_9PEZI|nr:hypothetical protein B0T21DRAFT_386004 [Apiosordaria backusii]
MHIRRALQLFVLGLSAASVADATFVSPRLARHERALQRRQDGGDEAANTASDPADEPPPPSTSNTPTPTPPSTSSTTPPITSSTSTPPPEESSTSTSISVSTTTSPRPGNSVSSTSSSTTAAPDPNESDEPTTHIQTITRTIVTTNPDGKETTVIDEVVTTSTSQPSPNGGGGNKEPSGMTEQTRNTVIGVVVGIGGAIVLAGLGFVAWRIWGKKKQQEEQDTLMDDYSAVGEKPDTIGSTSTRTPFQSTLESYHAPTQVNTASNF